MIVPSGIYSDKGTGDLRKLFLNRCDWKWIFSFENRKKIFDIDGRFKFCPLIFSKGGKTTAIKTSFMRHNLEDWENGEKYITWYKREQVEKFSPWSLSLLEINSERDIEILDTIYSNSVLLGDDSPGGWGIKYATEFHMTNDSKLFPPRPVWEEKGYKPDEYGRWIGPDGDVALPLYEGRMIGQFDFSQKGWVSGKGRTAVWREIPWEEKVIEPQYLMQLNQEAFAKKKITSSKIAYMRISSSTNSRTMISSYLKQFPAGDSVFFYKPVTQKTLTALFVVGIFNSFTYDYQIRKRLGGLNLSDFIVSETALPLRNQFLNRFIINVAKITLHPIYFPEDWLRTREVLGRIVNMPLERIYAYTNSERLRCTILNDVFSSYFYGIDVSAFRMVLSKCDLPFDETPQNLDPKGFWRVDKDKPPELRHTVLSLVAFHDLQKLIDENGGNREKGIEAFCNLNNGEGWMLPEKLRLADYGLGHDDRAKEYQPVAEKFGPRFYDWQLEQTPEESWEECERHARNILGEEGFERLQAELRGEIVEEKIEEVDCLNEENAGYGEQMNLL